MLFLKLRMILIEVVACSNRRRILSVVGLGLFILLGWDGSRCRTCRLGTILLAAAVNDSFGLRACLWILEISRFWLLRWTVQLFGYAFV